MGDSMRGERVLISTSGGRDSVVLAHVLVRVASRCGFEIVGLAYVHHGPSQSEVHRRYRAKAQSFVVRLAEALNISALTLGPAEHCLSSEEQLRDFRRSQLDESAKELNATVIAIGHHADDLFETRLIRLIRGTGARGLQSMRVRGPGRAWRPLLNESSTALSEYATACKLEWIEDPSNQDSEPLRNWIRLKLLPLIEAKREGSGRAMARSLEELAHLTSEATVRIDALLGQGALLRNEFENAPRRDQCALIAATAAKMGVRELSKNHVDEILKRLLSFQRSGQKSGVFVVSGLEWALSPNEISARVAP